MRAAIPAIFRTSSWRGDLRRRVLKRYKIYRLVGYEPGAASCTCLVAGVPRAQPVYRHYRLSVVNPITADSSKSDVIQTGGILSA
jgi:hypothetical protein